MNIIHNSKLKKHSQQLRREMTKEERKLWYEFLKKIPLTIKRQKIIKSYIVDFCIDKAKLIIELDGSQHYDVSGEIADRERDDCLKQMGYKVLRFTNLEISQKFSAVCTEIERELSKFL